MTGKQRISAFTVMEMIVALMLSALVIVMAYTAYSVMMGFYSSFKVKNETLAGVLRLDELFNKDFSRSEIVYYQHNKLEFKDSSVIATYRFLPQMIIRQQAEGIDTFKIAYTMPSAYFEAQEIKDDTEKLVAVDRFEFKVVLAKDTIPLVLIKYYSSKNLFNLDFHAGN